MPEGKQHTEKTVVGPEGFRRPVSPTEWWFAGHPDDLRATTEIVVEGTGRLDPAELAGAVATASAACPGARLTRDGSVWVDSGVAPAVHTVDGHGLDPAEVLRLPELQAVVTGPGTCEVVLVEGTVSTVVFRADHAVMDAKGVMLWAVDVFRALRGEAPLGAPDPVSDQDVYAELAEGEELVMPAYDRAPVVDAGGPTVRGRAVSGRRSLQGTHPGLISKLATTLVGAAGLADGRFYVPVDLRHHRPGVRTTANLSSGVTVDVPAGESWEAVHERLLRAIADGEPTRKAPPADLLRQSIADLNKAVGTLDERARGANAFATNAVLSHAGRLALADLTAPGFTPHTAYHLARPAPTGAPELAVAEVDDRTELTVSWWDGPDTVREIEALLDRIEEALVPAKDRDWPGNDTDRPLPDGTNVVARFTRQAAATPDAIAISSPEGEVTYAELAHRSAVVAAWLRERGVGRDTVVGVLGGRTVASMIAVWGVLRAGAAYLPLEPQHPDARLAGLLTDAGAPVCLLQHPYGDRDCVPEGCARLVVEDLDHDVPTPALDGVDIRPEDLANVIYTSGSTGRPKGVEIVHGNLANFAHWAIREFHIDADTRLPLIVSLAFDVAGNTIYLPLLAGGTIVLRPGDINHATLRELLTGSGANCLCLTPSHLDLIGRLGLYPKGFRSVVSMGEPLRRSVARRAQDIFGPDCEIINSYGPTETTIVMTMHVFDAEADTAPIVTIGVPTDNSTVFVIDSHGRFAPEGEPGEMWIGGAQVARGYRGRPELTREKFVRLADGTRVYRSGDIGRLLPDGRLEFIARTDDQVKILGHRIEPSEIAQALETHPAVGRAVVVPRARPGQEHKALCAYVTTTAEVEVAELNEHVARLLPKYMVPAVTMFVDDIGQTVNGKVDVRGLPDPFDLEPATVDVSGRDELTTAVVGIWSDTLGLPPEQIAGSADFYQLGGNSVLLLSMVAAVAGTVVGAEGEPRFMTALGQIIREPTLDRITDLARAARTEDPALTPAG